jgi:hypothetical protein
LTALISGWAVVASFARIGWLGVNVIY